MSLTAHTALTSARLEELLADESIAVVHRTLWLLLWEDSLRVHDLLALEVPEVRPDAGAAGAEADGVVVAGRLRLHGRAAELLCELVGDRTAGPVFAVGDRALTWEAAVLVAQAHGLALHAFRTEGKRHRSGAGEG